MAVRGDGEDAGSDEEFRTGQAAPNLDAGPGCANHAERLIQAVGLSEEAVMNPSLPHRSIRTFGVAVFLAAAALAFGRPVDAQRRVAPDSLRRIQEVEPVWGPPGTEVTVFTENLPLQAKVHIGVGATRTGFEALHEAEQGMWGEVSGTITIPESAPWDRAVLLVAFDAIFAPIGLSDPFTVTRPDGTFQRTGEVTDEGVECLAMRDTDGFLYTLIGSTGDLEPGDPAVVRGRYVEASICQQGTTMEVVEILPPPSN